jgi:transcriptional regulator with XRE-family HTH domain
MNFQERLIFFRKQRGLSQEQLGHQIGVSRQTVSKWELGETTPELEKLFGLSKLFDVSIDELVGNTRLSQKESASADPWNPIIHTEGNKDVEYIILHRKHYEYKSKRSLFGMPLVHINYGHGFYKARGVVAIGNFAEGIISIGFIAAGLVSVGLISAGLLSLGILSAAALFAFGVVAVGCVSFGSFSVGILAFGAFSLGMYYSIGAVSYASHIAFGAIANASIAIGDKVMGEITFQKDTIFTAQAVRDAILEKYPHTWPVLVDLFAKLAESMRIYTITAQYSCIFPQNLRRFKGYFVVY